MAGSDTPVWVEWRKPRQKKHDPPAFIAASVEMVRSAGPDRNSNTKTRAAWRRKMARVREQVSDLLEEKDGRQP